VAKFFDDGFQMMNHLWLIARNYYPHILIHPSARCRISATVKKHADKH
jgi:hypothetical protein